MINLINKINYISLYHIFRNYSFRINSLFAFNNLKKEKSENV